MNNAEQILVRWIEANIGPVVRLESQGRWRPAWFVDVEKDGKRIPLYVRGARADALLQPQPLDYEYRVFELFERSGVRTPHIYGYVEDMPAIVMSCEPGGPDLKRAASEAQRSSVTSQFVDELVKIHRVDPIAMERIGALRPKGAEALALGYYRRVENLYAQSKSRPEPSIEFVRRWLNENIPQAPDVAYPITVDAGQFIFEDDRLTAILDLEYSTLGDYHTDLAALRLRDRIESLGDVKGIFRLYAQRSGLPVDAGRLRYHTVVKGVLAPMTLSAILNEPATAVDYLQYLSWEAAWMRISLEAIAEVEGWDLGEFRPPEPAHPRRYDAGFELLEASLDGERPSSPVDRARHDRRLRLARFMKKCAAYQDDLDARYLTAVAGLTGASPDSWLAADAVLERFVMENAVSASQALLKVLWHRNMAQCFLVADPACPVEFEALITPLERFDP